MHAVRHAAPPALALALLVAATAPAQATNTGGPFTSVGFGGQAQLGVLGTMTSPGGHFGGMEIHGTAAALGVGLAAGLGYERCLSNTGEEARGGYLLLALQLRPLILAGETSRWFDVHLGGGGRFGGLEREGRAAFRAAGFLGAGFDVRLGPWDLHPVLNVQYRWEPSRTPELGIDHRVLIGLAVRTTDE